MIRNGTRAKVLAAVMLMGIGAAACDVTEPDIVFGLYALASVDGDNVPSTMFEDGTYKLEVVGGELEMETDSTYEATITSKETVDAIVSEYVDVLRGDWTQDVTTGTITFTLEDDNSTFTGSWEGRRITILLTSGLESSSLVFEKPR